MSQVGSRKKHFKMFKRPESQIQNNSTMDFKDKLAVVTGGAQGIGRCIADEFQKAGAHVCVIDK